MEYTFFSPDDADDSQKTRKVGYTAYGPTEELENGPFLGRKASKTYIFEFSWLRDHAEKIERLEEL